MKYLTMSVAPFDSIFDSKSILFCLCTITLNIFAGSSLAAIITVLAGVTTVLYNAIRLVNEVVKFVREYRSEKAAKKKNTKPKS